MNIYQHGDNHCHPVIWTPFEIIKIGKFICVVRVNNGRVHEERAQKLHVGRGMKKISQYDCCLKCIYLMTFSQQDCDDDFRCDVSCAMQDDHYARNSAHSVGTWKALRRCVFDNVGLIHHFVRNAIRILPKNTCMASHLRKKNNGNSLELIKRVITTA